MNCEGYVVYYEKDSFVNIYPKNISGDIFGKMCACATDDDTLVIRRQGDMIYYLYLRRFVNEQDKWLGIATGVNLVVIDDLAVLHDFFCNVMRRVVRDYHIAYYDNTSGAYSPRRQEDTDYNIGAAARRLADAFNARFSHESTRPDSMDYTKQPGKDAMSIKTDGKVMRFATNESDYAQYSVRQSIERGNAVVATNERTFEQETASLRKQLKVALEKTNELQIKIGFQDTRIANLEQQLKTYRQGVKPIQEEKQKKQGKFTIGCALPIIVLLFAIFISIVNKGEFGCSTTHEYDDTLAFAESYEEPAPKEQAAEQQTVTQQPDEQAAEIPTQFAVDWQESN